MSLTFLKQSLTEPKKIGAITESSEELAEKIISIAELENVDTIVELGPGTGIFTEKIAESISPSTLFFALEVNEAFVEKTKERCPNTIIYNAGAEEICTYLSLHNKNSCDCIISSLPFASFDEETQDAIFKAIDNALAPNGQFITFSYFYTALLEEGKHFRKLLRRNFSTVEKSDIVWLNVPPAFVYSCRK
ncbi:methyltransferase domain-containing protein [Candidatus Woesearchaeota archaeon]|nr:methyltransferase domain-containing protein [Candidatus Woesearchaeota archaeon]